MIMEQKFVKVPFDVELAKKIQNKECEGGIVTRNGEEARILCYDRKDEYRPLIALVNNGAMEVVYAFSLQGKAVMEDALDTRDLMLEVPEYMTFKDGDIIAYDDRDAIVILKGEPKVDDNGIVSFRFYVNMFGDNLNFYSDRVLVCVNSARKATPEEIQKLEDRLKKDDRLEAKDCLKKFFGIESENQYKDGDVLFVKTKDDSCYTYIYREGGKDKTRFYIALDYKGMLWAEDNSITCNNDISELRKATDEERQKLIDAMQASTRGEVKECLKRISKAEQKQKYEFKPFDKVLARDYKSNKWKIDIFREFTEDGGNEGYRYNCFYDNWNYCIPYNEQTKHLLGTTDNWE